MSDRKNPLFIDPADLAGEWLGQPAQARAAGHREAEARREYSHAKARYDVVRARLYLAVRSQPAVYGLRDKATVDEIEAAVTVHQDHLAALNALNEAQYALDVARADTVAYVDRRKALENLVGLRRTEYAGEHSALPADEGVEFCRPDRS